MKPHRTLALISSLALPCTTIGCNSPPPDPCQNAFGRVVVAIVSLPGALLGGSLGCGTGSGAAYTTNAPAPAPDAVDPIAPGACTADPSDTHCVACLRVACCAKVDKACGTGTTDPATCAADPEVKSCILGVVADSCAPSCSADGGAS